MKFEVAIVSGSEKALVPLYTSEHGFELVPRPPHYIISCQSGNCIVEKVNLSKNI